MTGLKVLFEGVLRRLDQVGLAWRARRESEGMQDTITPTHISTKLGYGVSLGGGFGSKRQERKTYAHVVVMKERYMKSLLLW